jgi:hypothetical protein
MSMKPLSLSGECVSFINQLDMEYARDYPSVEDQEMLDLFREATKLILASREGFTGAGFDAIEELVKKSPDFISDQLDDFLTRLFLGDVAGIVGRVIKLSRLDASARPSHTTAVYIQEAVRTYIYGFPQASVAISRAALEQALKGRLGRQGDGCFIQFQDLVEEAKKWKILDATAARQVRDTAKRADLVLHEMPTDRDGAWEVLTEVRGLLQEIYATDGGF